MYMFQGNYGLTDYLLEYLLFIYLFNLPTDIYNQIIIFLLKITLNIIICQ